MSGPEEDIIQRGRTESFTPRMLNWRKRRRRRRTGSLCRSLSMEAMIWALDTTCPRLRLPVGTLQRMHHLSAYHLLTLWWRVLDPQVGYHPFIFGLLVAYAGL